MTTEYPMLDVVKVKPMEAFRLWVRFSDGSEGVADLSRLAARTGPMAAPLKDPAFFGPSVRRGRRAHLAERLRLRAFSPLRRDARRPLTLTPLPMGEGRG